jgi:SAM-dependent methyltransferase
MTEPSWPEHGAGMPHYHPWHLWTSPDGAHHAGYLLDTVIGPHVETGEPMTYEIVRCEPCIAIHAIPLLTEEALAQYYAREFYQRDKPDMVERYERDQVWWREAVHKPLILQAITALQTTCIIPESYMFLDIGAGPGLALDTALALNMGIRTFGLEPNKALCKRGWEHGHTMFYGTLESRLFAPELFHVAYCYETLEHQSNPEEFLLRCWDVLAPGGILIIVVPNDYNPFQMQACEQLGLPKYWLAPPQHLFYFTPKCLQLVLRRCGFALVDMRGTYPLERFLLHGQCYVGDDTVGRACHEARMAEELAAIEAGVWDKQEAYYRMNLMDYRCGREIVAIAQKRDS